MKIRIKLLLIALTLCSGTALAKTPLRKPEPGKSIEPAGVVIARIWHGRIRTSKADEYYEYLKQEGIERIKAVPGNLGVQVLRRTNGRITEFTVISYWESLEAIKAFAGSDIEKAHNLPKDRSYLLELEPRVKHFQVVLDDRKQN